MSEKKEKQRDEFLGDIVVDALLTGKVEALVDEIDAMRSLLRMWQKDYRNEDEPRLAMISGKVADALCIIGVFLGAYIEKSTSKPLELPFPWGDSRVDARLNSMQNWRDDRPKTFEELLQIGRRALATSSSGRTRNIGEKSIVKLDAIFDEYGFGERWMVS